MYAGVKLYEMYWAALIISRDNSGSWLLLEQSISKTPMETIEKTEATFKKHWHSLSSSGVKMVRLNIRDGKPADLMFAWGQGQHHAVTDVHEYDSNIENAHRGFIETESSSAS